MYNILSLLYFRGSVGPIDYTSEAAGEDFKQRYEKMMTLAQLMMGITTSLMKRIRLTFSQVKDYHMKSHLAFFKDHVIA